MKLRNKKMWIWIVLGGLAGLVVLVFVLGSLLPERYLARAHIDSNLSRSELWARLRDFEQHPMSGGMCKSTERLPDENGLPVWIEDIGSSKIRVQTVEVEEPGRIVREMKDQVVPMTATSTIEIRELEDGRSRLAVCNDITVRDGTWHVPIFRVLMSFTGGARGGVRAYIGQVVGGDTSTLAWE